MAGGGLVTHRPRSVEELAECLRSQTSPVQVGNGAHAVWCRDPRTEERLELSALSGVLEVRPADQIVVVQAGTPLEELRSVLAEHGLGIPDDGGSAEATVGGRVAMNLPHERLGQTGSWRDWVIGLQAVLADGTIFRSGSKVVKSVAGFDLHRMLVGSRGTLAVLTEVTLRVRPLASIPAAAIRPLPGSASSAMTVENLHGVRPTDLEELARFAAGRGGAVDEAGSIVWYRSLPGEEGPRFSSDWVVRSGDGDRNLSDLPAGFAPLLRKLKKALDPDGRLTPGALPL